MLLAIALLATLLFYPKVLPALWSKVRGVTHQSHQSKWSEWSNNGDQTTGTSQGW